MNKALLSVAGLGLAGAFASAANAVQVHIIDGGVISPGYSHSQEWEFHGSNGDRLYGFRFTITESVTLGSNLSLIHDTFGSSADTESALYVDGGGLLAINDDFEAGVNYDSYLGFGDADQPADPYNGGTNDGDFDFPNATELAPGTYLFVVGPYSTEWDKLNVEDSIVTNLQGRETWYCNVSFTEIPAPGALAAAGLGMFFIGGRRRRQA